MGNTIRNALALALLIALAPVGATAQPAGDDTITMNMRDAEVRSLIQWVADQTGRNMVVHRDVKGKVTILSSRPMNRDEIWSTFLAVLQMHGFAAIESDGVVKIVPASIASQSGAPLSDGAGQGMVVQVFRANNISAPELAQLLRPLVSKDAVINADPASNMLLVADTGANVQQIQQLVQRLDRAGGSGIELVRLQHANATEVLASLTTLYPNQSTSGGAPGAAGGALPLTLSADARSNAILMSGDPSKRSQVRQLIRQMDVPLSGEGNTQVIYLQYVDAKEVAPILKSIAQSVLSDRKEEKTTSFSIESSDSANALVINAPPGLLATLQDVARKLDVRRSQVLVEALIVEVSSDIADDIGVSWITTDVSDLNGSGGFGGVNTLGNLSLLNTTVDSNGNVVSVQPGKGITFGYYESGDIRAAIRALNSNTKANILSTPTVVAIDNEPASLLVGQNVPFITGSATSAASGVENPFQTIERKDIGISLEVTPRINRGDSITLEIKQTVENIAPSVANASDLITNKREIVTKALIKDDNVLVLGGLISEDQSEAQEKVPVLGDLPLIGRLFSGTSKNRTKRNLMVFIHPVILRDEAHVAEVSRRHYDYMRERQIDAERNPPRTTDKEQPASKLEEFEVFSPVRAGTR
jgi:general secretion pathway protein D